MTGVQTCALPIWDEHRLFANLELRTGTAFLWNAGGMLEQLQGDEARLAPRVFLNWQAAPRITWRIGHSRAWRQPDLFARNVDIRITDDKGELVQRRQYPNPDLRPQRIDASEIGFLGVFGDSRSTLDVRLFRERIEDLIVRNAVPSDWPIEGKLPEAISRGLGSTRWENHSGRVQLNGIETTHDPRCTFEDPDLYSYRRDGVTDNVRPCTSNSTTEPASTASAFASRSSASQSSSRIIRTSCWPMPALSGGGSRGCACSACCRCRRAGSAACVAANVSTKAATNSWWKPRCRWSAG